MTEATPTSAHEALAQVRTHFTHWRQQRPTPRGTPIPQPLWAEAVRLTQLLPLTQVAKHLALKPAALRRHAGLASVPPAPPSRLAPTFVEVTRAPTVPTTEVELQRPDGARLHITYRDTAPGLAALVQLFLEPR